MPPLLATSSHIGQTNSGFCTPLTSGCQLQATNIAIQVGSNGRRHADFQSKKGYHRYSLERRNTYNTYEARLQSYVDWPRNYVPKTPEVLSAAGFFYIGSADRVTCYHCGTTLRDWEARHDPVTEHQRYSDNCAFIQKLLAETASAICPKSGSEADPPASPKHPTPPESKGDRPTPPMHLDGSTSSMEQDLEQMVIEEIVTVDEVNILGSLHSDREVEACSGVGEAKNIEVASCTGSQDACGEIDINVLGTLECVLETNPVAKELGREVEKDPKIKSKSKRLKYLLAENTRLKEQSQCRICKARPVAILFLPCGHHVTCPHCAGSARECVRCSKPILGTVRTYMT